MIRPPKSFDAGRVAARDDRNHVSGCVGRHADDSRALNRAPGSGVVGNGATGVTVTYRPDARSLTNKLPP